MKRDIEFFYGAAELESASTSSNVVETQTYPRNRLLWALVLVTVGFFGFVTLSIYDVAKKESVSNVIKEATPVSGMKEDSFSEVDDAGTSGVPNIIFLLIDDQGHNDMPYVNPQLEGLMPNIKALADEGIKFTQYYTESLCTPARAALMTGKYSIHTGMQHELVGSNQHWGLPLGQPILPEILEHHGYTRRMVGKWHLGFFHPAYIPTNRGFESHLGYFGGQENYYAHSEPLDTIVWKDWFRDGYPEEISSEYDGGYSLSLFAQEVDEILISHDQSKPLFLYYATQATHAPLSDPPRHYLTDEEILYIQALTGNDDDNLSQRDLFLRTSVALDKTIGQMIETLKATGMYENTIILAGSDNGGCAYYGGSNYPLRGEKRTQWEGGVRTNGFVHSPLLSDEVKGTTFTDLFHVTDWIPTIIYGILGNSTQTERKYDGVNQWDAIQGLSKTKRKQILYNIEIMNTTDDSFICAYRDGPFKLVYGEVEMDIFTPIIKEDFNYCESDGSYGTQSTSLFNIPEDGSENINIVEAVEDGQLSAMWNAIDGFFTSSVKSAYDDSDDFRYYKTWLDHDRYTVPWYHYREDQLREHLPDPYW